MVAESRLPRRALRTSPLAAAVQVVLVLAAVVAYFGIRGLTEADPSTAVEHARDLVRLEAWLGIDREAELQQLVLGSHAAVTLLNWVYIWGHWPVIAAVLLWLLLRHPDGFRLTRDALVLSGVIGVVIFVSYPVAPPRLADMGLVDTITQHSQSYRVLQPPAFVNQYAAVPSLHVGWDLLIGLAVVRHARWLALRALGVAMPVAMVASVVLTGNHYLLDIVAGVAVALTGLAVAARRQATQPAAPRAGGAGRDGPRPAGASPRVPVPRAAADDAGGRPAGARPADARRAGGSDAGGPAEGGRDEGPGDARQRDPVGGSLAGGP